MIIFEKIRIKNFFAVGNSPVEIELNKCHKTLVRGKNGQSKTSNILDSVVFALFGKPFRKINKNGVINSINKGGTLVEIWFSIGSKQYKISRGLKPNIFEIYCDDKLINQDSKARDYQDYLEKYILRTNYKSFVNTVVLGSARYNPFMSLSSSDRKDIIEDLLDIQVFSTMNNLVKEKLSNLKERLLSLKYEIDLTNEKIKLQKQNLENEKLNVQNQIDQKNLEIKNSELHIQDLERDILLIEKHIDILYSSIKDKTQAESKRNKLNSLESKIEVNLKKIRKEFEFYDQNNACPTCKQSIEESHKKTQFDELKNKETELNLGFEKLKVEKEKLEERLSEITDIVKKIQDHSSEVVKHRASMSAINKFIQKELAQINELTKTTSSFNDQQLNELNENMEAFLKEQDDLLVSKKYYDYCSILLKDGGIKTKIVKQYIPVINKYINKYLSKFNFFVNFNIDENFNEVIKSRNRDEFVYSNFSEGEKVRIDLSLLFTFRQISRIKNSVNTNLLIMDEIIENIDDDGVELFLTILDEPEMLNHNIFIISHKNDNVVENFDRILKFEKKKNFTRMNEIMLQ